MNYRHQYHAGNFADVLKHALFVRLIRALQKKEKGVLMVDTHAGRGAYDLESAAVGTSLARAPEWPDGIGKLWNQKDLPEALADYLTLVKAFDSNRGNRTDKPAFYPGSPALAKALQRPQDRLFLYEKHPEERDALAAEMTFAKVRVEPDDGYRSAAALLPPLERRALVLIDPPFEDANEWARIAATVQTALERLPSAVIAVWYPITARADRGSFLSYWRGQALPPTLSTELVVDAFNVGLRGCGVIVFNPPWGIETEARAILDYLKPLFAKTSLATASVTWPVPEKP